MRPRPHAVAPWLSGALLLAVGLWSIDLAVLRAGVPHPLDDTWEYGVAARHLLAGDGLRTSVIHPPLWGLRDSSLTVPVLVHGPLAPALAAPLVRLLGPRAIDFIAWLGALFAILAVVPVFRIAERHFDPAVGAAAAGLFTLSPLTIRAVNHDPGLPVGACLIALALELSARDRAAGLAAGLSAGLASLVRPEVSLAGLLLLVLVPRGARGAFLLGFLACAGPWWLHQYLASGSPFFSLSSYLLVSYRDSYPGLSALRDFDLTPSAWPRALFDSLPSLWRKWLEFAPRAAKHALFAPSGGTGVLALFGWAGMLRDPRHSRLARASLLLAAVPVVLMLAMEHSSRYVTPFLPLWALAAAVGARELARLLAGSARGPAFWMMALSLLILPSTIGTLRQETGEARRLEGRLRLERDALARMPEPRPREIRLMFSDSPDFVAWTTGRPTVWVSREEFERLYSGAREPARMLGLPQRGEVDTWFHADVREPGSIGEPLRP